MQLLECLVFNWVIVTELCRHWSVCGCFKMTCFSWTSNFWSICRKKWIDSWYQIWSEILDVKKKFSCYKILAVCHLRYIMSHLTMTYCNVMQCKSHNRQLQFITFWTGRVILYREASQGEGRNPSAEVTHSTDTAGLSVTYLLILSVLFIFPTYLPFKTHLPSHLLIVMELSIKWLVPSGRWGLTQAKPTGISGLLLA